MVKSKQEVWFDVLVYLILALLVISVIFPFMYVLSVSLTPLSEVLKNGGFVAFPRKLTLEAYSAFIHDPTIPRAYGVTIFITVVGTLLNLLITTMMAYPLSKSRLPGRNILLFLVAFTLLFNGGVVPTYLVVKATGLINSVWSLIIPSLVWSFNLLIMKTFFENLPESLDEAARIDGAGELRILWTIVLPLSLPIFATIGLFYAVGHWNEFFQAIMYVNDTSKYPLQVVLKTILINSMLPPMDIESVLPTQSLQMAAVVLSAVPIIIVYPFIQKYFTQGVLLGGIKG
jgi:putative aldouronate transport system permease protein